MSILKKFYASSTYVAVFAVIMFIVETFYPLGGIIERNFGLFGSIVGNIIAIWGLVGMVKFYNDFVNKFINK